MNGSGIYAYIDTIYDEIVYVGQSKRMWDRHVQHTGLSNFKGQPINQILQMNRGRYKFIILKECPVWKLDYWEQTLIALFNPRYNQDKCRDLLIDGW